MKKGWSDVVLGDVAAHRNVFFDIDDLAEYKRCRVRLHAQGVELRDRIPGALIKTKAQQRCRPDDFLVAEIDAKVGGYGIVPKSLDGAVVSSHYFLFEADRSVLVPRFLGYFSRSRYFAEQVKARGSTNYAAIRPSHVLSYTIPLPPMAEQQRIVAHLEAIETRLTRAQKLREEQEHEIKGALSSAFHKLEADVTWKPLAEVAPLAWRQIAIDPDESYTEFGVRSFYKGVFLRRKVAGSTFSWQELYRLKAGDIVFSNIMAWEKAIAIAHPEHDGWVGNHRMLVCAPRPDVVLPSYLLHYFMTSEGFAKILQASPGTVARNKTLKADDLMAIEVPIPSLSRQRTFESLCEHVARIRAAQRPQIADAAKIIPSLLNRIFNS